MKASQPAPLKNRHQPSGHFEIHTLEWFTKNNLFSEDEKHRAVQYEMFWVRSGTGCLTVDMQEFQIGDNAVYCLCPGQVRMLRPGSMMDGYYISLSPDYFHSPETVSNISFLSAGYTAFISPVIIYMDEDLRHELEEILVKMRKEFLSYCSLRSEIIGGLVKVFLLYLSRKLAVKETEGICRRDTALVKKFIQLLGKHFITKKMVADYASELSVTPSYLTQVVKKVSGFTASHHIQQYVVLEAKRQAIHTGRSMKEIAYGLGFDDIAHFSKFFKTNSGVNFTSFKKGGYYMQPS